MDIGNFVAMPSLELIVEIQQRQSEIRVIQAIIATREAMETPEPPKPKRGRPKGSKTRAKVEEVSNG